MAFAGQLARKITRKSMIITKIGRKSIPGEALGHPKSIQNRSWDPRGTPHAAQERSGGVSGRPRGETGAPGGSQRAPRDPGNSDRERPGARRGDQNRRQNASGNEEIELFSGRPFLQHRRSDFLSISVDFRCVCEVGDSLKVPRLPAKTEVLHFVLKLALDRRFWVTFERQVGHGPAVLGTFACQVGPGPAVLGAFERQVGPGGTPDGKTSVWGTRWKR